MARPAVVVVGADKGGVGKTTVSRTLLDYFSAHSVPTRAFDTEAPRGTLKRFHPDVTDVVDVTLVSDQMLMFDTIGTAEADLQPDGTPNDGETPLGDPGLGLRVMGAGEEMELVNPVVAGTELLLESTLAAVTPKQTRTGTCVFVTTLNTFTSADGTVLNRNRRTVVLRNPVQES